MRGIAILVCVGLLAGGSLPSRAADTAATKQTPKSSETWTNVYHHQVGVTFHFPDGWTRREAPDQPVIYLIPNDGIPDPRETILVTGGSGDGITNVSDKRVLESLESLVHQSNAEMKRAGKPEAVKAGARPGMAYTWEAKDANDNVTRIRVYVTLLDKYIASLAAYGPVKRVEACDPMLRRIFSTFDFQLISAAVADSATPNKDLAGMWLKVEAAPADGGAPAKSYGVLREDGTALLTRSLASAKKFRDTGKAPEAPADAGDGLKDVMAKWTANGSGLTVTMGENVEQSFGFQLRTNDEGKVTMRIVPLDGSDPQEWTRQK